MRRTYGEIIPEVKISRVIIRACARMRIYSRTREVVRVDSAVDHRFIFSRVFVRLRIHVFLGRHIVRSERTLSVVMNSVLTDTLHAAED